MTSPRARLAGVDATRGLAVLGMAAAHVLPGTRPDGSTSLSDLVVSGRSSAAFAVLAGVGVALWSRRGGERVRLSLAVRALLLGALGLALGELDTGVSVILVYYAVFFLLLLPFLGWPPRRLLTAAAAVALVVPWLSLRVRPQLALVPVGQPTVEALDSPLDLAGQLLLTGVYPALPWAAYLLTGLAVGRLALDRPATAVRLAAVGAVLAAGAALLSAALLGPLGGYDRLAEVVPLGPGERLVEVVGRSQGGNVPTGSVWWLATDARHSSTPLDLVATTGSALLALGLLLLLARVAGPLLGPLAAVGSMPLTAYTAHLCVLGWTDSDEPLRYWLLQVGVALVVATLWRRLVGRGPLEALLAGVDRAVRGAT